MSNKQLLAYNIQGTGSPFVFLHGFLENRSMWNEVVSKLTGVRTIQIDLPGHGDSPISEGETMLSMAEKVEEVLTFEKIKNPIVIGHSMGGYVGLELIHLIKLKQLVLFHSNFWEDTPEKKHNRDRVIKIVDQNKELFIREAIPGLFNPKYKSQYQNEIQEIIAESMLMSKQDIIKTSLALRDRKDHSETIEKHAKSITIVHGLEDPLIPNELFNIYFETLNQQPSIIRLKACGHMGHVEMKTKVIEIFKGLI
jgi:pimeloyl-ACP methyl ester carboxylesterase